MFMMGEELDCNVLDGAKFGKFVGVVRGRHGDGGGGKEKSEFLVDVRWSAGFMSTVSKGERGNHEQRKI